MPARVAQTFLCADRGVGTTEETVSRASVKMARFSKAHVRRTGSQTILRLANHGILYCSIIMYERLEGSWPKVKRAKEHISDLHQMLIAFAASEFYTARIEHDAERRINTLCFDIDNSKFPTEDSSLLIGDAVQNLRGALDHLWYQVVLACGGTPTNWTRFPFDDSRDALSARLKEALEKQRITLPVVELMLSSIVPYKNGNPTLCGLNELGIMDRHQMFVPVLKMMSIRDLRLEDQVGRQLDCVDYILDDSSRVRLHEADDMVVQVKNKGRAAATIFFDIGAPFEGEPVLSTLRRVTEEVSRTIEAFNLLITKSPE
ncbi:MAG TPA: hypothetical protein VFO34_09185 [Candidatus Acidoferrales bacterium]|nr:hypothetical protein [Candidatus Acidoferrales bacterium]